MTEQNVTPVFDGNDVVSTICAHGAKDEADEFLRTLDRANQAKFHRYLERLRDGLHVKSPENMRHIKGVKDPKDQGAEVHELKVHRDGGLRLYLVRYAGRWYITHGVKKVKDSGVPKQARRAFAIFWNE